MKRWIRVLACLFGLALVASCATAPSGPVIEPSALTIEALTEATRLGPGDKARIIVYGEPQLSGEFTVNDKGLISFPLLGDVEASGQTIDQFKSMIEEALEESYFQDPRVAAEIISHRPFYIMGEVNIPGEYAFRPGLTVVKAVATAGGFTYRANKTVVLVQRAGETEPTRVRLNDTLMMLPGDLIRIQERYF